MNPVYKQSIRIYKKNKKVCDKYKKGFGGFCLNCDKLHKSHFENFLEENWVLVDAIY